MLNSTLSTPQGAPTAGPAISSDALVRQFHTGVADAWDEFAISQPTGSLFHTMAWKRVIEKTFGFRACYYYSERNNKISGILPLFRIKNWLIGDCLHSVPFGVYGGVCAADSESLATLNRHAKRVANEDKVSHLELRQRGGDVFADYHANELYTTFTKKLSTDIEADFKKIPRDTRYMIRKGEKLGLRIECGLEQLDTFYNLFCQSMSRLGTPVFPFSLFENCVKELSTRTHLMMTYSNGTPVAGVLSFLYKDVIMPYYAGASPEAPTLAANNFMYWQLMKYASESGVRTFDFGRSKKNTGAYRFKAQWGMEAENLKYQVYLVRRKTVPNFSPVNPKFAAATRVWQHLPLWLSNRLGPGIVRWFP